jgi:hypothetical protein
VVAQEAEARYRGLIKNVGEFSARACTGASLPEKKKLAISDRL